MPIWCFYAFIISTWELAWSHKHTQLLLGKFSEVIWSSEWHHPFCPLPQYLDWITDRRAVVDSLENMTNLATSPFFLFPEDSPTLFPLLLDNCLSFISNVNTYKHCLSGNPCTHRPGKEIGQINCPSFPPFQFFWYHPPSCSKLPACPITLPPFTEDSAEPCCLSFPPSPLFFCVESQ